MQVTVSPTPRPPAGSGSQVVSSTSSSTITTGPCRVTLPSLVTSKAKVRTVPTSNTSGDALAMRFSKAMEGRRCAGTTTEASSDATGVPAWTAEAVAVGSTAPASTSAWSAVHGWSQVATAPGAKGPAPQLSVPSTSSTTVSGPSSVTVPVFSSV